jgi:hypothetical protein
MRSGVFRLSDALGPWYRFSRFVHVHPQYVKSRGSKLLGNGACLEAARSN